MLGDNIKKARKNKKLSQKELAKQVGISASYIQQLELGQKNNPSLEILIKLGDILDIPLDLLANEIDIDDLQQIKNVLLNKKSQKSEKPMELKDAILLTELLSKINKIQSEGSYTDMDIEIILNEFSLLLKTKVNATDTLKTYISSKKYDITKLSDEMLKDIDRKFSEILELEFFKLNK